MKYDCEVCLKEYDINVKGSLKYLCKYFAQILDNREYKTVKSFELNLIKGYEKDNKTVLVYITKTKAV